MVPVGCQSSPDVPVLLPLGILSQPVEGWRAAPGGRSVTPHSFYSSIGIILHLLEQVRGKAAVWRGRGGGWPLGEVVDVQVVVAVGAEQDPGGCQGAGRPPPPVGVGGSLPKGHCAKRDMEGDLRWFHIRVCLPPHATYGIVSSAETETPPCQQSWSNYL